MCRDDPITDGEAQAGSTLLRTDEGLEDPAPNILRYARAVILEEYFHHVLDRPGADAHLAAFRHGIISIQDQIDEYLFELVVDSQDWGQLRR